MIKDFLGAILGWRICHRLFGWDYVMVPFASNYKIRRLEVSPTGEEFVDCYGWYPLSYYHNPRHLTRKQDILAPVYDNKPLPRGTLIDIRT